MRVHWARERTHGCYHSSWVVFLFLRWISNAIFAHKVKVAILWGLAGASLASMFYLGRESLRETLQDPLAYRAIQLTLPICWWLIAGISLASLFILIAIYLAKNPPAHVDLNGTRSYRSSSRRSLKSFPKPTRVQPLRSCRMSQGTDRANSTGKPA